MGTCLPIRRGRLASVDGTSKRTRLTTSPPRRRELSFVHLLDLRFARVDQHSELNLGSIAVMMVVLAG